MIWFDVSKVSGQRHKSGLSRVSRRLEAELSALLGDRFRTVVWKASAGRFVEPQTGQPIGPLSNDWLLTPELFSEDERPGLTKYLARRPCRMAAVFHDAIPLLFPEITWPKSVSRHPHYMKQLAGFDRVLAVSDKSRDDLLGYWRWLGLTDHADVSAFSLGADLTGGGRGEPLGARGESRRLLMLGIVEPRKGQAAVMDACERLWASGLEFSIEFVGRVNPFFGKPIAKRMRTLRRAGRPVFFREQLADDRLAERFADARFSLFPSIAEGCGLPVLESLWMGVPCLCSDIEPLRQSAAAGGCQLSRAGDVRDLEAGMRRLLTDDAHLDLLSRQAATRPLPTWENSARKVLEILDMP